MIRYFETKEKKHLNDLLFHLRAHNNSFTGEKLSEIAHIYVVKNDKLLGAMKTSLSWDWVGLNDIFYHDDSVLLELLSKACDIYKDKAVGLKFITKNQMMYKKFVSKGFLDQGHVSTSPKNGTYYFAQLTDLNFLSEANYHTISSKEVINEYDIISKAKKKEYKEKYNEEDPKEEITYVAYEDDVFAGGIYIEVNEDSLYIDLLAVNKDFREKKIGTKLMLYAEQIARVKHMVSIELGTAEFQARAFYEKLGYEVVFTRQNYPKGFECYTLVKKLDY